MTQLQLLVVLSLPITGLCYATLGAIKLPLSKRLSLDEARVGGLISTFGFMVGPIILLCGAFSDTYGRTPVWVGGSILVCASFVMFAFAKRYPIAVLATVLLATGWTAMINVANPVMAAAFKDPFTGSNIGDALFGGGAFLCPLLVVFLHKQFGFTPAMIVIAVLSLVPAVLVVNLELGGGELKGDLGKAFEGFSELLSDRTIWLLGLTLMCWVVIESGTAGWASTLVKEAASSDATPSADGGDRIAAIALSAFWLCFMGSRLLTAFLVHGAEMDTAALVSMTQTVQVTIAVLAVLTMIALAVTRSRPLVIALVVFAGLICGPFFPNLIGQLITHLTAEKEMAYVGRAVGVLFACASVGWTLLPVAMGFVGRKYGVRRAFLLPAAGGVVMIVLILINKISI